MRFNLTLKLAVVLLFCTLGASARMPGFLQRFQIGYSFVKTSANYEGKFLTYNAQTLADTSVIKTGSVNTSAAYGITMGTYFPINRGNNGSLAIGVDWMYNFMLWKGIGDGLYTTGVGWDFSGVTINMGLPVGLEYKFGCDGTLDKKKRFCFTVGGGVHPSYSLTSFEDGVGAQFNAAPFAKVEAGVFAGICMKVRLMYSFSSIKYISKTNGFGGVYDKLLSDFTLTGKPNMAISLIFMPFSWGWPDDGWWNRSSNSYRMYKGWKWRHKNNY